MISDGFALAVLNTAAFLLCASFLAYIVLIAIPYLRHRRAREGDARRLRWHLLIPCRDEEQVITTTVRHLLAAHPYVHLWCVDDGSTDTTGALLSGLAAASPRVHVVTRTPPDAATGKGPALNAGWAALDAALADVDPERVVVGVIDADTRLAPGSFDVVSGEEFFGDREVGAVQIQVRVRSQLDDGAAGVDTGRKGRTLVRLQDMEFSGPIAAMQLLRRRAGSVGMGGNGQFTRLSVLRHIAAEHGTPWHGALLEDFELGLHVLLAGHRTEYCDDTWVAQEGLTTFRALVRQRSRWAQGAMQCLRYLPRVLTSRRILTGAALEIAYFLVLPWLQLLGGAVYATVTAIAVYYALDAPGGVAGWLHGGAWGILPLFVVFGLAPFVVWGPLYRTRIDRALSRRRAIALGVVNVAYDYLHHVSVWWAFLRVVGARRDWKKTIRVAAPRPATSLARDVSLAGGARPHGTFGTRRPGAAVVPGRIQLARAGFNEEGS